jgi:hypothetical protein
VLECFFIFQEKHMLLRANVVSVTVAALLGLSSLSVFAQDQKASPVRVRGTIDSVAAGSVVLTTRDGRHQSLILNDATRYSAVTALDLSAIKPGSFIGAAGKPGANGKIEALEVVVFPEAARGTGEGHYDWDLMPGSSMTNATVSAVVSANAGRSLALTYQGKHIQIDVPKDAPVVTFVPAVAQELHPGLTVFAVANHADDGTLTAVRLVLEKNGVKPPM